MYVPDVVKVTCIT